MAQSVYLLWFSLYFYFIFLVFFIVQLDQNFIFGFCFYKKKLLVIFSWYPRLTCMCVLYKCLIVNASLRYNSI